MIRQILIPSLAVFSAVIFTGCGDTPPPAAPVPDDSAPPAQNVKVENTFEPMESGSLKIQMSDEAPKPAVATEPTTPIETGTTSAGSGNVQILTLEEYAKRQAPTTPNARRWNPVTTPSGRSLAAKLPPPTRKFLWQPLVWRDNLTRTVRISDICFSRDKSLMAVAERTGGASDGSRIIIYNTNSWEIFNVIEAHERSIDSLAFPNASLQIAAACLKQNTLRRHAGLATFDIVTGAETAFRPFPAQPNNTSYTLLSDNRGHLFVHGANTNNIIIYNIGDDAEEPRTFDAGLSNFVFDISPNAKNLVVAGADSWSVFQLDTLKKTASGPLPAGITPNSILFVDNGTSFLLAPTPESGQSTYFISATQSREIPGRSAGTIAVSADGRRLLVGKKVKNAIDFLDAVTLEKISTTEAEIRDRKISSGDLRKVFFHEPGDAIAIWDSAGNFFLMHLPHNQRKYVQHIVFTPK